MSLRIVVKGWVPADETPTKTIRAMWQCDKDKIANILQDLVCPTKKDALNESKSTVKAIRRKIVCTITVEDVKGGSSHD